VAKAHGAGGEHAVPRRVWGATLLAALARQWSALCGVAALLVLARALALADFGRFTFYLAVFAVLDTWVDCGTSSAIVQLGAGDERRFAGALAAGRRVRLAAALSGAALLVIGAALGGERELGWVCLAAPALLARVPETAALVFQRELEWGRPLLLRALGASTRLGALSALATFPGLGFGPFLAVHAWSLALGQLALARLARPQLPPRSPPLAGLFAQAWPLAALGLVQQAYFWADNAFVRASAGAAELGRYNAAVRAFQWLAFFAAFATTAALPWLARRAREGMGALGEAAIRLAQPLFAGACALCGALLPWRELALERAFGVEFRAAAPSLAWLLGALVLVGPGAAFLTAVIAAGRTRAALRVALLALAVNLGANALLVPRFGAEGAAGATLLTEGCVTLASAYALTRLGASPRGRALAWLFGPLAFAAALLASRALCAELAPL
jgi:O-antigen/teichoic acid export membrane protein